MGKVAVLVGPGAVAHVAVAESLIRKKINDFELDLCYRQGRPVPAELKIPVPCRFFDAGDCSLGGRCQYTHGLEELEVAKRMSHPSGSQLPEGTKAIDALVGVKTSPTSAIL